MQGMKKVLIAAALGLAACGGSSDKLFKGDAVIAELRLGVPFCQPGGVSGPTITTQTVTATNLADRSTYQQQQLRCDWTCGNIGAESRALVYVIFYTQPDGTWVRDAYADPGKASCP
jgi:hypothetical protein